MIVRGAHVLGPDGWIETDVVIDGGTIASLGTAPSGNAEEIDGRGKYLGPGFVDLHVHLRDPGQTWKEDIETGTSSAARGGFTAVVAMPNTDPPTDTGERVSQMIERAKRVSAVDLIPAGTLTAGRAGAEMAGLDDMYEEGVRIFTDDGDTVGDAGLLRRIMAYLADRDGAVVAQHPEDRSIAGGGHLHEGRVSRKLGINGLPASAEVAVIARDIALLEETGARYHVQHLSTAGGVELVRRAKESGLDVTAEVTPHHLAFTEEELLGMSTNMKMYPPLREPRDREALVSGVLDRTIDAIATDHAPHSSSEKDVPFEDAPRGVIGLETAFAATLGALGGDLDLVFEAMSMAPARIAGLGSHGRHIRPGAPANLVLVDPTEQWTAGDYVSRSSNSPFTGLQMKGRVVATIVGGQIRHGVAK